MKSIYPILSLLLASAAFGCRIDYPFEYLAQKSDVIITGEIEKMDYDLPHEAPYEDLHYSLAYVKIDEVLKSDVALKGKEYFTFRVASKKDGEGTTATVFWDKGMKGTWFFQREDDPHGWVGTTLKPADVAEKVKKELSYSYKRRFGDTYSPHLGKVKGAWPKEWKDDEEVPLISLIRYLQLLAFYGEAGLYITADDNLDPNVMVNKINFDQSVMDFLREIANQYDYLDFEFGDHQIMLFDRRKKAEPGAVVNASAAAGKPENHLHD